LDPIIGIARLQHKKRKCACRTMRRIGFANSAMPADSCFAVAADGLSAPEACRPCVARRLALYWFAHLPRHQDGRAGRKRMRFSANLGFLFSGPPLAGQIRAAAKAGFDAVECHAPYAERQDEVRAALEETGLSMVSLNTAPGSVEAGEFGLAAVPGREADAARTIGEAISWARALGARYVNVLAGRSHGVTGARETYLGNLATAAELAAPYGVGILVEPINRRDVPGYFLATLEEAAGIVTDLERPNVRIMVDCYHMQIGGGDLLTRIERHLPLIGHIQFASVPERSEPDEGEVLYEWLLPAIERLGYEGAFGAEYRPRGGTEEGLGWLGRFRERANQSQRS
jgi:hydroxypyruvate isomerase